MNKTTLVPSSNGMNGICRLEGEIDINEIILLMSVALQWCCAVARKHGCCEGFTREDHPVSGRTSRRGRGGAELEGAQGLTGLTQGGGAVSSWLESGCLSTDSSGLNKDGVYLLFLTLR